jgi:transposase
MAAPRTLRFILLFLTLSFDECIKIDEIRASVTDEEQRAWIKIEVIRNTTVSQVFRKLKRALGRRAFHKSATYNWYHQFESGTRYETCNLPHSGRPTTITDPKHEEKLEQLMQENRAWRIEDLADELSISYGSTWKLLHNMGYRKISSKWVPHELTMSQMKKRREICAKLVERYSKDHSFVSHIISIDETWIKSYDPTDARLSREWRLPGEPR